MRILSIVAAINNLVPPSFELLSGRVKYVQPLAQEESGKIPSLRVGLLC